jgi:hypothetical protein
MMATPFDHLAALNRLVHEPSRLAILTALSACEKADFLFLLNITGLTKETSRAISRSSNRRTW